MGKEEKQTRDYLPEYFESLSEVYQIVEDERKERRSKENGSS